jgi:polygalacturonase
MVDTSHRRPSWFVIATLAIAGGCASPDALAPQSNGGGGGMAAAGGSASTADSSGGGPSGSGGRQAGGGGGNGLGDADGEAAPSEDAATPSESGPPADGTPSDHGSTFSNPSAVVVPTFPAKTCGVKEFGAKGDGAANDTPAINMAISACNAAGGGTVTFPAGTYMAASIHLMSNVRLQLDAAATIKGRASGYDPPEPNPNDAYQDFGHSHWHASLIWGENLVNVAIVGPGKIDGTALSTANGVGTSGGDKQIALKSSDRILFDGLSQTGGGHAFYMLTDCSNITMQNLKLKTGRDGLNLVGCRNVNLHDLSITACRDDTIALKSDWSVGKRLLTDNVTVSNSTVESNCHGLQIGCESAGDFQNISFSDITILQAGKSGIGIQSNDSGIIRNVSYDRITIQKVAVPIFISTTDRLLTPEHLMPGYAENIQIRNVTATDVIQTNDIGTGEFAAAATISGMSGIPHRDIVLSNVSITYKGGGVYKDANITPPDPPPNYNPRFMGPRPSYGFFVRHVKNLQFHNVKVSFESPDLRPAWVAHDVDGLEFDAISAQRAATGAWPSLKLDAVVDLSIHDSPPFPTVTVPSVGMGTY